jgi:peroxisomal 2,4-dienoyl-CoA reductase
VSCSAESPSPLKVSAGAAGNFLAPISGMSENAFRTVIEIDTVGVVCSRRSHVYLSMTARYLQHDQSHDSSRSRDARRVHSRQRNAALPRSVRPYFPRHAGAIDVRVDAGKAYQVHVSAAKAAVDATSAVLAVEEGPHGVRSNVIAPGPIAGTEGMDRLSRTPLISPLSVLN